MICGTLEACALKKLSPSYDQRALRQWIRRAPTFACKCGLEIVDRPKMSICSELGPHTGLAGAGLCFGAVALTRMIEHGLNFTSHIERIAGECQRSACDRDLAT